MALVYLGHAVDDRSIPVAIKVPDSELDPNVAALFLEEAAAARRVAGPGVVKVIDWGKDPDFIAFEYVADPTLAQVLRGRQQRTEQWEETELVMLYTQLARSMMAINQHVVHRDLKPENIFLCGSEPRVSDFGIAKFVGAATRAQTFKGWGTPSYMSPEALRGDSVTWATDQYSLGVVFFEMATLRLPFAGTPESVMEQHLYAVAPAADSLSPQVSPRLASIIGRMLQKRPDQRFASWTQLVEALEGMPSGYPAPAREDPILAKLRVAKAKVDANALSIQRKADEAGRLTEERERLLDYWAKAMFGALRSRVTSLNQGYAAEVIRMSESHPLMPRARQLARACTIGFEGNELRILLFAVSNDLIPGCALWGQVWLKTEGGMWGQNLLLESEPEPYGSWFRIVLKMSVFTQLGSVPRDGSMAAYSVPLGPDRLVVAENAEALAVRRERRNIQDVVNYSQLTLDWDQSREEWLTKLIEDA